MDAVPVAAGGHRHPGDGEVLVQLVEGGRQAAPAGHHHTGAHLHGLVEVGAVEQPVQEGDEGAVGRGVVDRRGDHKPVGDLELGGGLVDRVVKDAAAEVGAAVAGDAAPDGLRTDLDGFGLDALLGEHLFHFRERKARVASHTGAAVDHQDFHEKHLALIGKC